MAHDLEIRAAVAADFDADAWFGELGYSTWHRDQEPDAIRQTAEFTACVPVMLY